MIRAEFTEKMQKILSDMKEKMFLFLECDFEWDDDNKGIYGNFRIYVDNYAIDFRNEVVALPFFGRIEDLSCFSCEIVRDNTPFKPFILTRVAKKYEINEKIVSMSILRDEVNINNDQEKFSFDVALIIKTDKKIYMFARDIWFSELITLEYSEDYDKIFSIEDVIDSFSNEGEYDVKVSRKKIEL